MKRIERSSLSLMRPKICPSPRWKIFECFPIWKTATDKLIQIILLGQPELETLLKQPALRQFRQRIAIRAVINPLTEKESQAYIEHRLLRATRSPLYTKGEPIFTKGALKLISKKAAGIPRRLNILCDNALITGFGNQQKPVSTKIVKEILTDIDGAHSTSTLKWAMGVAAVLLLGFSFLLFGPSFLSENFGVTSMGNENNQTTPNKKVSQKENVSEAKRPSESFSGSGQTPDSMNSSTPSSTALSKLDLESEDPSPSKESSTMEVVFQNVKPPVASEKTASGEPKAPSQLAGPTSSGTSSLVVRSVKRGENLTKITKEIYGSTSPKYVEWVQRHNPEIVNPDLILPGQEFVLPDYEKE